jgi:hypothetical protein
MAKGEASKWWMMVSCVNLVGHSIRPTGFFFSHCLVVILCFFFSWLMCHAFQKKKHLVLTAWFASSLCKVHKSTEGSS